MDSNIKPYNFISSFSRIDGILDKPNMNYEEKDKLPDRDDLTYDNGFYAYCTSMFVDIRDSSNLPVIYNRPALAKLYRAFISEMVAVMNSHSKAREINIVGDCVWAVFNTPTKPDIDEAFALACTANSLMKVLNYKLLKKGYETPLKIGIGLSYGRALMIKAGYNGSGISDVVYMGDVINQAAKLASQGGGNPISSPIVMDLVFRQNLNEHNTGLTYHYSGTTYYADAIISSMNDWYNENCK